MLRLKNFYFTHSLRYLILATILCPWFLTQKAYANSEEENQALALRIFFLHEIQKCYQTNNSLLTPDLLTPEIKSFSRVCKLYHTELNLRLTEGYHSKKTLNFQIDLLPEEDTENSTYGASLEKFFSKFASLEALALDDKTPGSLTNARAEILATAIKTHPSLQILNFDPSRDPTPVTQAVLPKHIKPLDNVKDLGVIFNLENIRKATTLTKKLTGLGLLLTKLSESKHLHLHVTFHGAAVAIMAQETVGFEALKSFHDITSLTLQHTSNTNGFYLTSSLKIFAKALGHSPKLKRLSVEGDNTIIDTQDVVALGNLFKTLKNLEHLNLILRKALWHDDGNPAKTIASALENASNLISLNFYLNLQNTSTDDAEILILTEAIRKLPKLENLIFYTETPKELQHGEHTTKLAVVRSVKMMSKLKSLKFHIIFEMHTNLEDFEALTEKIKTLSTSRLPITEKFQILKSDTTPKDYFSYSLSWEHPSNYKIAMDQNKRNALVFYGAIFSFLSLQLYMHIMRIHKSSQHNT